MGVQSDLQPLSLSRGEAIGLTPTFRARGTHIGLGLRDDTGEIGDVGREISTELAFKPG